VLTADDMARWRAHVEPPLGYDYGRYTVYKPGPWSQGPVMLQQLALLKAFNIGADATSAEFVHLLVECSKLAYADREKFYGDPEFTEVPMTTAWEISEALDGQIDAVIDSGADVIAEPTTVIDFSDGFAEVLRVGAGDPSRFE
jgi:gamma-glutamyltranspeptidase/glutathione hydrolase